MIICDIAPLEVEPSVDDPLYKLLEIHMQSLGLLIPFREKINWKNNIERVELGESGTLHDLKKLAAKNDGVLLFIAKWFKQTVYHQLILHPNTTGYYLPLRFDEPFIIEFKNKKYWFGSSLRLKEELTWLEMTIKTVKDEDVIRYWENYLKSCEISEATLSPFKLIKE